MPLRIIEQIRKQRNLISVLLSLVFISGLVVSGWYYFVEKQPKEELTSRQFKKIEIDFDLLNHPLLKQLQTIEQIPAFEGEIGRENPFGP